jgi:prevent-host-death family protein
VNVTSKAAIAEETFPIVQLGQLEGPVMPEVPASQARDNLAELISRAAYGKERIILTRRGKQLAAVVPMEDVRRLEQLQDEQDLREARKALIEVQQKGTTSLADLKAELGL